MIENNESLIDSLIDNETNLLISVNQSYINTRKYGFNNKTTNLLNPNDEVQLNEIKVNINETDQFSFVLASITNVSTDLSEAEKRISSFLLNVFDDKKPNYDRIVLLCEYVHH